MNNFVVISNIPPYTMFLLKERKINIFSGIARKVP